MLNTKGVGTQLIHLDEDVDDSPTAYQFYGAYPFSMEKVYNYMKKEGKRVVYDTDDALDLIDETNPFYYAVKKDASSVNQALQFADQVTVSTPAMKEYMQTKTDKPITVIPNCFTPSDWNYTRPTREGIRIGFAGSSTHVSDLIEIIPVIKKLQSKYDIHFIIMGFGQNTYEEWYKSFRYSAPAQAIVALEKLDKELSQINFEWVPFLDYWNYPATLINMALDIGLCPLKETPFNRCRSACKAMEYTLAGALAIASDVEAYRNDGNAILVKDGKWEEVIEMAIKDDYGRKSQIQTHLEWTQEFRNIETQLETLKTVYGVV